ncbi:MAG TPA: leucine-rich repeat domain-containing protein [Anaerolineae bacterium]|nr:leucine-rich repeat domain-containing protein [Anaerolineae bacterium]
MKNRTVSVAFIVVMLLGVSVVAAQGPSPQAAIRYAAPTAQGSGDCSSWANACTLQTALAQAVSGNEIWVKAGVYYPGAAGNREATFILKDGVALYGGFAGTETSREQRDWQTNPTILSGDIDRNDINNDGNFIAETWNDIRGSNAYNVVISHRVTNAVLDGFVITAGQTDFCGGGMDNRDTNTTLTNVTFSGNYASRGGGMFSEDRGPTLTNVTFIGNSAYEGGGMLNWYSSPTLSNVTFSNNSASSGGGMYSAYGRPHLVNVIFLNNTSDRGGAVFISEARPTFVNVLFYGNTATSTGGAVFNLTTFEPSIIPVFINSILWSNSSPQGPQVYNSGVYAMPVFSYSNIQGSGGSGAGWDASLGTDGGGNIDADPRFVDAANGDLHLRLDSPCIDAGDNTAVPAGVTTDLDGYPRFVDIPEVPDTGRGTPPVVDMGAYEAQLPETLPPTVISITRADPNPTRAASVRFNVTFSKVVIGVDVADFGLTTTGDITGASVTGVSGYGAARTVMVNTGSGYGTLRLDVPASATITDLSGNGLANLPYTSGEVYTKKPFECSDVTEIPQSQCQALVALYNATDGRNWARKDGWLITDTPCNWYGVWCAAGNVDLLWLSRNNLSGTLPGEIGNLSALTYLDLSGNQLTGLPEQFGNLMALQVLHLHDNPLSGAIPDFMANLTALGGGGGGDIPLTFYNTDWCVPATGPVPAWLASIPHEGTGFVCGQPAGAISGQVTRPDGAPLEGINVQLYRSLAGMENEWLTVAQTSTAADGGYQFGGLGQGISYRVYFVDPTEQYIPQYYNNQPTRDTATSLTVTLGITRTGVDAILRPPPLPVGDVDPGNGTVNFNPDGTANIQQFAGNRSPVTVTLPITCSGGMTPTNVNLVLLTSPVKEYAMNPVGADLYQATIPAEDIETAGVEVRYACNGNPDEKTVGQITLYDPSGIITDARSGAPVVGARVTLYYVPGWLPRADPADTRPNTCESNLSKAPGAPWSQPAPVDLGVLVNPVARPVMPAISYQHTNAIGYYGWDVPEGCWYVQVEAEGYVPLVSPVVGVPPAVTDLNLALRPIQRIYLPLVVRNKP